MKRKTIYDLDLHEDIELHTLTTNIIIMRVPGGWLYDCHDYDKDEFKQGTFIPFNDEYK